MIVSYASPAGRRVVLADANPGILGLPTTTLHTLDEVARAVRKSPGVAEGAYAPGSWAPPAAGDGPFLTKVRDHGSGAPR